MAAVADEAACGLGAALTRRRRPVPADGELVRLGLAAITPHLRLCFG